MRADNEQRKLRDVAVTDTTINIYQSGDMLAAMEKVGIETLDGHAFIVQAPQGITVSGDLTGWSLKQQDGIPVLAQVATPTSASSERTPTSVVEVTVDREPFYRLELGQYLCKKDVPSMSPSARRRIGLTYEVRLFGVWEDEENLSMARVTRGTCACEDFRRAGINAGRFAYRCKHINLVVQEMQAAIRSGVWPDA